MPNKKDHLQIDAYVLDSMAGYLTEPSGVRGLIETADVIRLKAHFLKDPERGHLQSLSSTLYALALPRIKWKSLKEIVNDRMQHPDFGTNPVPLK